MSSRSDLFEGVLGPLEADVMDAVWELGDTTVRDVHEHLAQSRKIAYTTVMTTMTRLADKSLLHRDTSGVAHRYSANVSREDYGTKTVSKVLGWLLEKYPEPAVSYLANLDDVDDLDALRAAVADAREREQG